MKKLCNTCTHLKKDRKNKPINLYCNLTARNIKDYGEVEFCKNYVEKK